MKYLDRNINKKELVADKTEGKFSCRRVLPLRCAVRYMGFENIKCIYLNVKVKVDAAWLIVSSDAGMARFRFRWGIETHSRKSFEPEILTARNAKANRRSCSCNDEPKLEIPPTATNGEHYAHFPLFGKRFSLRLSR